MIFKDGTGHKVNFDSKGNFTDSTELNTGEVGDINSSHFQSKIEVALFDV